MTPRRDHRSAASRPSIGPPRGTTTAPPTRVEILVCGSPRHGDDAAACVALEHLAPTLGADVRARRVGQLALDDLLAVAPGAGVVVVDTAVGLAPGWTVEFPINGLAGRASGIHPRASFALSTPETLEVVSIIRDAPTVGMVVVIGGLDFGLGEPLSWPVLAGMDAFVLAIADAVDRVRGRSLVGDASRIGSDRAEWPTANGPDATSPTSLPGPR
jgi:hypothetical protein